jgi:hypothetical protein
MGVQMDANLRLAHARSSKLSAAVLVAIAAGACGAACSSSSDGAAGPGEVGAGARLPDGGGATPPGSEAGEGGARADGGDGATQPVASESAGTRLSPLYRSFTAADGATWKELAGWFDAKREEPCFIQTMSDGIRRCAPFGEELMLTPDATFSDASCTAPVIGVRGFDPQNPESCSNPEPKGTKRYFRISSRADVCTTVGLVDFPATGPLSLTQVFTKAPGGACQAQSIVGWHVEVYAAPVPLTEVSPSAFVRMEHHDSTPVTASRLRTSSTVYAGEDGSSWTFPSRIIDSTRGEVCYARTASDQVQRCMPYGGSVDGNWDFSDPGCSQRSYVVANNGNCPSDEGRDKFFSYMEVQDYAQCSRPTTLYPRFTSGKLSTTYYGKPGSCTAQDVSKDWYTHYAAAALPAPIPASSFVPVQTEWRELGPSVYGKAGTQLGLRKSATLGDQGFVFSPDYIMPWDTKTNGLCYPMTLADGAIYCVPQNTRYFDFDGQRGDLYADAACTQGVFGVDTQGCGAPIDATTLFEESPFTVGTCRAARFYRLPTAPLATTTMYARNGSACAPYASDTSHYAFYLRSEAKEVPPTEFVGVKVELTH